MADENLEKDVISKDNMLVLLNLQQMRLIFKNYFKNVL